MRSNALDGSFAVLVCYSFLVLLDCDLHEGLPLGLEAVGVKALCGIRMQLISIAPEEFASRGSDTAASAPGGARRPDVALRYESAAI
jgi:hypothetical protein